MELLSFTVLPRREDHNEIGKVLAFLYLLLVVRLSSAQGARKPDDAEAVQQEREPRPSDACSSVREAVT